jgi:hypothetical protein
MVTTSNAHNAGSPHTATPPRLAVPKGKKSYKLDTVQSSPIHTQRQISESNIRARNSSVRISQSRGDDEEERSGESVSRIKNMLLGKGASCKVARARLPPSRQLWHMLRSMRLWLAAGLLTVIVLLWRSMGSAAGDVQRYAHAPVTG